MATATKSTHTPWERIIRAADRGTGLRLSASEIQRLSNDGAIARRAERDSEERCGMVCEKCHWMASEAGQLADTSAACHPAFDGEQCSQCGSNLYYPCYCDVIEP